jgi:sigma-B regulation protein RsbU (phosphoserine phosphatase)
MDRIWFHESLISRIRLFATLPPVEIERLARSLRTIEVPANTVLLHEGHPGECCYVVLSGELAIVKAMGTPDERLIGVRGEGEYIGEMSLLNPDGKRTASIRTVTPVRVLEITRAGFDALLQRHPTMAYEMVRVMSDRLTAAHNAALCEAHEKNRQLREAYEELKAAQAQIIEKKKLEHELQVARQIQESMLPREMPSLGGLGFGARMVPSRLVGGDFFDFVQLDDAHVGVAVADVSGKGTPAAMFMALSRSLLRAEARRTRSPRVVLENVNRLLLEMNDSGMFVTMLYGVLNGGSREFQWARAGHDLPIVFRGGRLMRLPPARSATPLGLVPQVRLDVRRMHLRDGDALVLYTDGITEADNERNELFGADRLRDSLAAWASLPAQEVCDRMVDAVAGFRGAAAQSDDITIVALRAGVAA